MAGRPKTRAKREAALKAATESNALAGGSECAEGETPVSGESESITGRPSLFSTELADAICDALIDGDTLTKICKPAAMPAARTVRRWAAADPSGFGARLTEARKQGAGACIDRGLDHIRSADTSTSQSVQHARNLCEAEFKAAAKLDPENYGDRQRIDMGLANLPDDLQARFAQGAALSAAAREKSNDTRH